VFTTVSESTLQESAAPQTTSTIHIEAAESRLVLGNRQIAAALFIVLALVTVIATLSYVAGRAMPAGAVPVSAQPARTAAAQAPEQVIVVDAKLPAAPLQPGSPAAAPPSTTPLAPMTPAAPVALPAGPDAPPAPGTVFFQVASVDKGMADVSVQYLLEKGFSARRAPGASSGVYRVLVGPLDPAAQMSQTEAKLKELGFSPFPKKY
jgi:cell division protein FtsN